MPFFTIITPVKNAIDSIARTVESVLQQQVDFELFIIDGGSTDGTLKYLNNLKHPRVNVISIEDCCIAEAINTGIECASGTILSVLDADDYYIEGSLLKVKSIILSNENIDVYCFSMRLLGKDIDYIFSPKNPVQLEQGMVVNHTATFIHGHVFDEGYRYSLDYKIVSDWDFLIGLQLAGKQFLAFNFISTQYAIGGVSTKAISLIKDEMHEVRRKYALYRYFDLKYLKMLITHFVFGDRLIMRSHMRNQKKYNNDG
jgi:glycosyltransferase involved in cell wall biosynthesis